MSWNRGESETRGSAGRGECEATGTSLLRLLGVAVGVAVVVGVWWLCLRVRSDEDVASPAVATEREEAGKRRPRRLDEEPSAKPEKVPCQPEASFMAEKRMPGRDEVMLADGRILRFRWPKEGETRILISKGRRYEVDHLGNMVDVSAPKLFDTPYENTLCNFIEAPEKVMPFALSRYSKEQLLEICRRPVEFDAQDSEETATRRMAVANLKSEIVKFFEDGGDYDELVAHMQETVKRQREFNSVVARGVVERLKAGDVEGARTTLARTTLARMNAALKDMGYNPANMPAPVKRALEESQSTTTKE